MMETSERLIHLLKRGEYTLFRETEVSIDSDRAKAQKKPSLLVILSHIPSLLPSKPPYLLGGGQLLPLLPKSPKHL